MLLHRMVECVAQLAQLQHIAMQDVTEGIAVQNETPRQATCLQQCSLCALGLGALVKFQMLLLPAMSWPLFRLSYCSLSCESL